jgi:hypothetical protein
MNKKAKIIWSIVGVVAIILIVLLSIRLVSNLKSDKKEEYSSEEEQSVVNDSDNLKDQYLEPSENYVFKSDLVGTWLTVKSSTDSEKVVYEGFVLRPDNTVLAINNPEFSFDSWSTEDYKLIFTNSSETESATMSYIVEYIGKDGLILRNGDTTVQYTIEAK